MDMNFSVVLYGAAALLLGLSYSKDRQKTTMAVRRAWSMFTKVLPQFILVVSAAALCLEFFPPRIIREILGTDAGASGMVLAAVAGAFSLVPVLAVFPVIAELLLHGAGIAQMAVFISTLTTVGIVTLPLEIRYFGKKAALMRNLLFFMFSFLTAAVAGRILG